MTRLVISEGAIEDLGCMMKVMERAFDPAFGEAWNTPQCLGVLGLPGVWLLIARLGERPAGFALSRHVIDEAELLLVAVEPELRGRGIARALMDRVFEDAIALGAKTIHLEMREGNPAARLYAAAGFTEVGRRRDYYRGRDGRTFDAFTLSRPLHSSS